MEAPKLSAVMVVSARRERAQRVLDALAAQTARGSIEIVVVDLAPDGAGSLRVPERGPDHYVRIPGCREFGRARAEGARHATAPVVAFIEDHCYPELGWAEALIEAHRGPWASVGYAFRNANPDSYVSRASMVADYGPWLAPATRGEARWIAGNNVSYKRDLLVGFGSELDGMLDADFSVHEALMRAGHRLFLESRAVVAHENWTTLSGAVGANRNYARLMAVRRASSQRWGPARKLVYAVGAALLTTAVRIARTVRALRGRPAVLWQLVIGLPVILAIHQVSAVGEALGYLRGAGTAPTRFARWELDVERVESA